MGVFHADYQNPADSAMPYLDEVPGTVTPYYQPYRQLGLASGAAIAPQYYKMATNPQGYYNQTMNGYTESPQYQYNYDKNMGIMQGDAAAGGYTGTAYDQRNQAEMNQGLMAQDQQQYYQNVNRAQQYGLEGGQQFYNTGYQASNTLATMLAQNLAAQAGLAYKGTSWDNAMKAQHRNNINSTIGSATGGFMYGMGM
jgi:hypothetical protein